MDQLLDTYRAMLRIRLFEESLIDPILKGEIKTPCHLCIGQEAVAVGVCSALRKEDWVFGNHRSHGHYLAKGGDMKALMAEIYGKETGCSRGRGGSMHIIDREAGFMGATPIVAGTVPLAVGAAMAAKLRGEDRVVVSFFGDGAMGEGVVYESLNIAALYELPILFVCENNRYATHLPLEKTSAVKDLWLIPTKMHSRPVSGMDVMDVREATKEAIEKLPAFLEMKCYRFCGHVGPDDNILGFHTDIRPKEEVEAWRKRDPVKLTGRQYHSVNNYKCMTGEEEPMCELLMTRETVQKEIKESVQFAQDSPWPDPKELERYVYA